MWLCGHSLGGKFAQAVRVSFPESGLFGEQVWPERWAPHRLSFNSPQSPAKPDPEPAAQHQLCVSFRMKRDVISLFQEKVEGSLMPWYCHQWGRLREMERRSSGTGRVVDCCPVMPTADCLPTSEPHADMSYYCSIDPPARPAPDLISLKRKVHDQYLRRRGCPAARSLTTHGKLSTAFCSRKSDVFKHGVRSKNG